jgi:hypothetical protein
MSIYYDPEERCHRRGRCARCGYAGWSDDSGQCPNCEPEDEADDREPEESEVEVIDDLWSKVMTAAIQRTQAAEVTEKDKEANT